MQAQDASRLPGHLQLGPPPQLVPGRQMGFEQFVEGGRRGHPVDRGVQRVADRRVAGGVQGDGLVDGDAAAGKQAEAHALAHTWCLVPVGDRCVGAQSGRHADADGGGAGRAVQPHRVRFDGSRAHPGQVTAVQVPVARDPGVGDPAVQRRLDVEVSGEALGRELGAQRRQMGVCHVHETLLPHRQHPALAERVARAALQQSRGQVQHLNVLQHLRGVGAEPSLPGEAEAERQPVRDVDHVLVPHPSTCHVRGELVVAAGHVGTGVVHVVRGALRKGSPSGEVAVAQCAQRLP